MANRILSGIGWTTASTIIRNVVALAQIAILTRFLDKGDFGVVAIANLFVGFTTLFLDMGISAGIIHRQHISNEEYSSLFWLNILFGIVLTFILYILSPLFASGYESENLVNVVRLICFTIFLNAIGTQQRSYCQKKAYFKRLAVIEAISSIVIFLVAIITATYGCGVYSLAYSTVAGAIVLNVCHFVIGIIKDNRLSLHFSIRETIPFLKIGIFQVGSSLLDFLTRELDIIIISRTLGLDFLGVYNIAKRIPTALYSFIQPIVSRVFTPLFAEINGNISKLKSNYLKVSKCLSWISFPMYLLFAAISPTIIAVVFGKDYIEGVPVMMAFCFRYAFNGVNGVCGALQVATGRTDIGLVWTIYLVISTAVIYYFSSLFGVSSLLIGICSLAVINVVVGWIMQFREMVGVSFREYLTIYIRPFCISIILSAMIYFTYNNSSILYAIASSCLFVIIYSLCLINGKDGDAVDEVCVLLDIPMRKFLNKLKFYRR